MLPVLFEDRVKAVIELASLSTFTASHLAFLEQLTASIGIVLNSIEAAQVTGGIASNKLDASLFTGDVTLIGDAGNDTYVVDDNGDQVIEAADAGTDTVQST